jgi:hypothetical protein
MEHFHALSAADGRGQGEAGIFAYSPVMVRMPDERAVRFASAITTKGAVEGIEPSLSTEMSFGPPGHDRERWLVLDITCPESFVRSHV